MAELDSKLVQKFKDYKKFERGQIARGVGALPVGLQALRAGGPDAADRAIAGMFDRGQTPSKDSPLDYAKLKLEGVKLLTDAKADYAKTMAAAGKPPSGKSSKLAAFEKALDAATQLIGDQGRTSVEMGKAKLQERMKAMNTARVEMLKPITKLDPGIIDSAVKLADGTTEGDGSLMNPGYWDAVAKLVSQTNGDPTARAALYSTLTSRSGITPAEWYAKMREAASAGAVGASELLDGYDAVQAQVAEMHQKQAEFAEKYEEEALKMINASMAGTPGADAVAKATRMFMDIYDGKGDDIDAAKASEEIVAALAGLDPAKDAQQKKAFDDLLNAVDKPPEQLPTHLREARKMVMEDPAFQKFMVDNNLPDPDAAFRELRRRSNDQIYANRLASKESVQQQKALEKVSPVQAQPAVDEADELAAEVGAAPINPKPPLAQPKFGSSAAAVETIGRAITRPTQSIPKAADWVRDQFEKRRAKRKAESLQDDVMKTPLTEEERKKLEEAMAADGEKVTFTPNSQGGTQLG